ncbi:proton-conducting transporter transmembrane domain-containing protein [Methanoplanus limicola]|uniref:NADH/Ubiquinone/plastoquinone (Complex I) n=1 Tax=Methanoplanus limicola DSM 2279 TaxID=937775 RepID=H1Z3R0_9EURY|nr:proton-conducting transporter membrane subunit [Methanoplanus limicola]EHQ35659.1 NADH/Ubiquinone/plastoquinone (complex I) [Methanoplanus limicola DSM 2279]
MIPAVIMDNLPALLIAVPLIGAFTVPIAGRFSDSLRSLWFILISLATLAVALLLTYEVLSFGTVVYTFGASSPSLTVPQDSGGIPFRIIFTVDAMSAFMAVSASIVGFTVALYSIVSDSGLSIKDNYFALILLMQAGILGMVCTGDLFNFFVFLEINSLAGAALVACRVDKGVAVEAGLKYAVLSTLSCLMILFAVGLFYGQYDALNMAVIADNIQYGMLDKIALVLMVAALAMKSGAVPMHFWTPDGYSMAPSSATAFLVVASQASLYGLFRVIFTIYNITLNWALLGWIIIITGILSMVIGVTMAIPQKDVKRLMAYHAVSQTGYMLLGVGVGLAVLGDDIMMNNIGITAIEGGIFHIINHAIYASLLFLTAGAVFYRTRTRNMNKLGGLGHNMKWTMLFFIIGALAIAGIPPLNGFSSKLLIYKSIFVFNPVLSIIVMIVSVLTLASFVKVFHSIFMGPKLPEYENVREVPRPMLIGMGILALLIFFFGVYPQAVVDVLITPATNALVNQDGYISAVLGGS